MLQEKIHENILYNYKISSFQSENLWYGIFSELYDILSACTSYRRGASSILHAFKNSFSLVSGVMAPRHLPAQFQGAFRARLHEGILHLLRPQGKPDGSFPNIKTRKRAETSLRIEIVEHG